MGYTKSEFYTLTSAGGDYLPIDLEGAVEVVLAIDPTAGIGGQIQREPIDGVAYLPLTTNVTPLVIHSTDGRLYFKGNAVGAKLCVWVIRG